jgi:hypothetical protein
VVATRCDRSAKIPVVEQIVSAGCAAHGLMLAAFAQELGAMWRTGEAAYDEMVKGALGIGSDESDHRIHLRGYRCGRRPHPGPGLVVRSLSIAGPTTPEAGDHVRGAAGMQCAGVAPKIREGRRFCGKCGLSLAAPCPFCGFANEGSESSCGGCG